jgi:deazaflavin-dependent oxidoreductase (nitroreductase family)
MDQPGWRYRAPLALTTIGRRSGRFHTVGLAYYDEGDGWVVVGSAGGSEVEPHWVRNIRANPAAWVHLHRHTTPVLAHVLEGEAKRPLWDGSPNGCRCSTVFKRVSPATYHSWF